SHLDVTQPDPTHHNHRNTPIYTVGSKQTRLSFSRLIISPCNSLKRALCIFSSSTKSGKHETRWYGKEIMRAVLWRSATEAIN
ncbi:hypothetical protein AKJ16_DCAP10566, partial [Drosera capensis]